MKVVKQPKTPLVGPDEVICFQHSWPCSSSKFVVGHHFYYPRLYFKCHTELSEQITALLHDKESCYAGYGQSTLFNFIFYYFST